MQIHFKTTSIPTRAAKRLKRLAGITESQARQWTAAVLGYRDWHDLEAHTGKHDVTPLDEKCTPEDLAKRRDVQRQRVEECLLAASRDKSEAPDLLGQWQPSAAHPQVAASGRADALPLHDGDDGNNPDLTALLLVVAARPATLPEVIEELLPMLQAHTRLDDLRFAAHLCIKALQDSKKPEVKVAARRGLEAIAPKEVPIAWFNLAMTLMFGDAGVQDNKRAVDLLERVAASDAAAEELKSRARSLVASAMANGKGRPADINKAIAGWEAAAAAGDPEAAFNAALKLHQPGVAASREQLLRAAALYRKAAQAGHVHAGTNLGLLLTDHRELEAYPLEGMDWIEKSAKAGDANARKALAYLRGRERDVLRALDRGELPADQMRATFDLMEQMMGIRKR